MTILILIVGIALIILGKKAVWLGIFSGVFICSSQLLSYFLFDQPETTIWLISGILAGICLFLYLFVENAMVVIAGGIGGGFLAHSIIASLNLVSQDTFAEKAVVFVIGGLIGILLLRLVFEWAMTTVSALVGAYLISSLLIGQPIFQLITLVGLTLIGVTIQRKDKHKTGYQAYGSDTAPESLR